MLRGDEAIAFLVLLNISRRVTFIRGIKQCCRRRSRPRRGAKQCCRRRSQPCRGVKQCCRRRSRRRQILDRRLN